MRPSFITALVSVTLLLLPSVSLAAAVKSITWKPVTPKEYAPITWAKAPGITSYFKAPSGNGALDFITRIYLPQNHINFIATSTLPLDWGVVDQNFGLLEQFISNPQENILPMGDDEVTARPIAVPTAAPQSFHNFAFTRFVAEAAKVTSAAQFIWNAPFFNVNLGVSDLSLALKTKIGTSTLVSSGSRPSMDMSNPRRMLLINNATGRAAIKDFEAVEFVSPTSSDQAIEGFAPSVIKSDSPGGNAARLFLGVTPDGKELVIYCSQSATVNEASDALVAAGVPTDNQLEADGGGSASCGYNLPGQYFVEPARTLPLMMGASTILLRGTATTEGLNVRSGPGTKYGIVTKLKKGEPVTVFAEKTGFYRIGDGQWVSKSLIKKI